MSAALAGIRPWYLIDLSIVGSCAWHKLFQFDELSRECSLFVGAFLPRSDKKVADCLLANFVLSLLEIVTSAVGRFIFYWFPVLASLHVRVHLGGSSGFLSPLMFDLVCPWTWVAFADVLTITQIVDALSFWYLTVQDTRGVLRVVCCWRRDFFGMCLSLICKRLAFGTQTKIAIWTFPWKSQVILSRIGFAACVIRNMIKISEVSVLGHTVIRVTILESELDNSITLYSKGHSTSFIVLRSKRLSLK